MNKKYFSTKKHHFQHITSNTFEGLKSFTRNHFYAPFHHILLSKLMFYRWFCPMANILYYSLGLLNILLTINYLCLWFIEFGVFYHLYTYKKMCCKNTKKSPFWISLKLSFFTAHIRVPLYPKFKVPRNIRGSLRHGGGGGWNLINVMSLIQIKMES